MSLYLDLDLPVVTQKPREPNVSETGVRRVPLVGYSPEAKRFVSLNQTKKRWSKT